MMANGKQADMPHLHLSGDHGSVKHGVVGLASKITPKKQKNTRVVEHIYVYTWDNMIYAWSRAHT